MFFQPIIKTLRKGEDWNNPYQDVYKVKNKLNCCYSGRKIIPTL